MQRPLLHVPPERLAHPAVRACVEAKLSLSRTVRAADRAGIDASECPALQRRLIEVASLDALLTVALEFCTRPEENLRGSMEAIEQMRLASETMRAAVHDALPRHLQASFEAALTEVTALEFEAWNEVESVRANVSRAEAEAWARGKMEADRDPFLDADSGAIAAKFWRDPDYSAPDPTADVRVQRLELQPLPPPEAPLRDYLDRAPPTWSRVMAQYHDIPFEGQPDLGAHLADRISDPMWMRQFFAERMGRSEREILADLIACGVEQLEFEDVDDKYYVPWDLIRRLPATSGGRLRAAGLVHVGLLDGKRVAVVPPTLCEMLAAVLEDLDPHS